MALLPVLTPDVEVSVKLRRHHLTLPGEPAAFVYTTILQAVDAILAHGFDEFVLHVGKDDYLCRPAQMELFSDHQGNTPHEPTGLEDAPPTHEEDSTQWPSSPHRCSGSQRGGPSRTP